MLYGHLVYRNGIGLGPGDQVDVVAGQPVVRMNVSADAPLDVGQSGKHGKMVTMMRQWLV